MEGFDWTNYESMKNAYVAEKKSQLIQEIEKVTITPEWTGDEVKTKILALIRALL